MVCLQFKPLNDLSHYTPTLQGKFAQAGPLYARATEIMEGVLGPEDLDVATTFTNQALFLVMQVKAKGKIISRKTSIMIKVISKRI